MAIYLDFIESPLWYHKKGLQQTASGYGHKLATQYKALVQNRAYRVYCSIHSNCEVLYILIKGVRVVVDRYEAFSC